MWRQGEVIGIDTDSSTNIACPSNKYLHNLEPSTAISVEGVGGMEMLNQIGNLIMPIRCNDGTAMVLQTQAYQGKLNVNILSALELAHRGYRLVLNASDMLTPFKGRNPRQSPEGHALVMEVDNDRGRHFKAIWLRNVDGILVMDVMKTKVTPAMIPHEPGRIMYRSGREARKVRTEKEARRMQRDEGVAYPVALTQARDRDQGDEPEIYVEPSWDF